MIKVSDNFDGSLCGVISMLRDVSGCWSLVALCMGSDKEHDIFTLEIIY